MGFLGAHVSISGGLHKAFDRAERIGCDAAQIFSRNQRQWKCPLLTDENAREFRNRWAGSSVQEIVIHDSYLINPAHPDPGSLEKSRASLVTEMERAEKLGVNLLVLHPGSYLSSDEGSGLAAVAASLDYVFERACTGNVVLLLETTAGQGTNLGWRFEHLAAIIEKSRFSSRIAVCFDTAHVFESGYDLRTAEAYEQVMASFDAVLGLDMIRAFHLNDSKTELATRVDRHANIGDGYIGKEAIFRIVQDSRFARVPMILETPGGEEKFMENLTLLRSQE